MSDLLSFQDIARLPLPIDNVAIAVHRIPAGTTIVDGENTYVLPDTVLEGHRFAVRAIAKGEPLLSWGLPFGIALTDIAPGTYVCNQAVLDELATRLLDFVPPAVPNFRDAIEPYEIDERNFGAADQVSRYEHDVSFLGYERENGRGVGTRNYILLLGTSSLTSSFVRQLEARLKNAAEGQTNLDGIVAVAHTEGADQPNNRDLVLRTLAGFMVHPNVGAVIAFDYGIEPIDNTALYNYMVKHEYPLDHLLQRFVTLSGSFSADLDAATSVVRGWIEQVGAARRIPQPASQLRIALQCGGSDAFSGISGNPLTAWLAREVIRYGGSANLAETDELIGAEPYILQRVRNLETARQFLATIERFKQRVGWHGHTAEGNPAGGNKFRGLYNINLKSIGAARKKDPDVRLDYVLEYAERMTAPGYYFMDSPGNDIESIAGQVASGSNIITFVTGNGSVTNFPFVPTIKVVTTTRRYELLRHDMDVNAGAYLDGTPMDELGQQIFALTLNIASGASSVGERAGHSQVQPWRNWRQTDSSHLRELNERPLPMGHAILKVTAARTPAQDVSIPMLQTDRGRSQAKVGLIIPTSLCSSEVAKMAAARLNASNLGTSSGISHFVSLSNTEGCGNSSGASEALYVRTILGYVQHPMAEYSLFLEHGCEKTHNQYMHRQLIATGLDPDQFGWASIQMDGGIDTALDNVSAWFSQAVRTAKPPKTVRGSLADLRLGLASVEPVADDMASALADLTAWIVSSGGTVVTAQNASLLSSPAYTERVLGNRPHAPTLAYGAPAAEPGFHIMETPTSHWVETSTGMGATGVESIVAVVADVPLQAHPLVPVIQVAIEGSSLGTPGTDVDRMLDGPSTLWPQALLEQIVAVAAGEYSPKLYRLGNVDFQITRGLLGVSM